MATVKTNIEGGRGVKLDPELEAVLKELGRAQTAYNEYGAAGRADLQQGAHTYANQVRSDAALKGLNLDGYGVKNQYGTDFTQYWSGGQAGNYDPAQTGMAQRPPTQPTTVSPTPTPAPGVTRETPATPQTNPLPSSTSPAQMGQQVVNASNPAPLDLNAILARAQNDARLQTQMQSQQLMDSYGRFIADGRSQIDSLKALYAPQYKQNELNTLSSARNAVQNAANRGFFASGLSADAELRANLAGEQQRMAMQGQENAQVGAIQDRMNLANRELGDNLNMLAGREGQLIQSLMDQYTQSERGFDLQNRTLSSDILLRMLGLNQSQSQFDQGLAWDMGRFGMQMGENAAQRNWQSGENAAQRNWQGQQNQDNREWQTGQNALERQTRIDLSVFDAQTRAAMQMSEQAWRSGQADLDRADSRQRWEIETSLKAKWQEEQMQFEQAQFAWRQGESAADRDLRVKAANSQWMAFADQAIQAGAWKTFNDAVKAMDAFTSRIVADGADMAGLYDYIRGRMDQINQQQGRKIPAGQPGNSNQLYSYFPNTSIGPAPR